jgi:gliding motility-associated-like protein
MKMNLHNRYKIMPPYNYSLKLGRLFQLAILICLVFPLSAQINLDITIDEPSCYGYTDGSITANATGGTAPYSYLWSNLQSGPTVFGIGAGDWGVTVTDATGITATSTITVGEPPLLETNIEPFGDICLGTDGELIANTMGGTPPYSFTWSSGQTTQTISNLAIGFYSVTVTDANNCYITDGTTINNPLSIEVKSTDASCFGSSDGSLEAIVTGGTGPYNYIWNNGSTDSNPDMLPTGTFTVTVTDVNDCTDTGTGIINEPSDIDITIDITGQCTNNINVEVTATGGPGALTYQWEHGPTSPNLSNLSEGNYSLTVTSNGICKKDTSIVVSDGVEINPMPKPAGCDSTNQGSVTVEVLNGIAPFTWMLSNGMTYDNEFINGLSPGDYSVTVVDGAGCSETADFEIIQTDTTFNASIDSTPASCGNICDGTATITILSGTPPYSIIWNTGDTTATITNLCEGDYFATISDAAGCDDDLMITVGKKLPDLEVSTDITHADCGDNCNGAITVTVESGGIPPYSYQWDSLAMNQTTPTITDLCPGTYSVTVSDSLGCEVVISSTVEEKPVDIEIETSATPAGCGTNCNGTATVEIISGGTAPFSIQWDANANNQTTETATNLCAGTYSVTITDFFKCTVDTTTVTVPDSLSPINLNFDILQSSCNGDCNGSATVIPTNGDAPYTYKWDANANNQTTQTASNLCPGEYEVTVTDAKDCTKVGTVKVTELGPLSILIEVTDASCQNTPDGCAEIINVFPSNPPFTIQWNNGATDSLVCGLLPGEYEVTVTDSLGCEGIIPVTIGSESFVEANIDWQVDTCLMQDSILVTFTDASIVDPVNDVVTSWNWLFSNGDTANTNTVQIWMTDPSIGVTLIVENAAGCKDTIMETINIDLFNCTLPTQDTTVCQDEILILSLSCSSNDTTLNYVWSPADMIIGGINTSSATINTSTPGEFDIWVDISSNIGCVFSDTTHVTVVDTSLAALDLSLIDFDQSCDTLEICFTNENDPLVFSNYTWYFDYPNSSTSSTDLEPCFVYPNTGGYTIALVPNANCLDTLFLDINIEESPEAIFDFVIGDCSDEVSVKFEDKSTPSSLINSWEWDFGNDSTSTMQNPEIFIKDSTQILDVVLTVEFEDGCIRSYTQEVTVRIFDPGNPQDTIVACGPGIEVELNPNGDSTYIYNWSPPDDLISDPSYWNPIAIINDTTTFFTNIDSSDCAVVKEVTVVFAESIMLDLMPDSVVLCKSLDTVLVAETNDNLTDMEFAWFNTTPFTDTLSNMPNLNVTVDDPTMYYVVVTDENNCAQVDSVLVGNYEINLFLPDTLNICAGNPIEYTIEGLQEDYELTWTPFDPQNFVPTDSATFNLSASNPQNCFFNEDLFINFVDVNALVDVTPVLDTIILGESVPITATNIPGFQYSWSNGELLDDPNSSSPSALPNQVGLTTFMLDIEDLVSGCRGTGASTICTITDLCDYPMIFFPNAFTPNGDGMNDVLYVEGINIDEVFFAIYNRWGEKVFESYSQEEGWDGTFNGEPAQGDAFAYYLRVKCFEGGEYFKKGNVTVIR